MGERPCHSEDRVVTAVALDAPSESSPMNLNAASEAGVMLEQVHRLLAPLTPIVGDATRHLSERQSCYVLSAGA